MVFVGVFVWDFLLVVANLSLCEVLRGKIVLKLILYNTANGPTLLCLHVSKWQKYNQVLNSAPGAQNASLLVSSHWPILNLFPK